MSGTYELIATGGGSAASVATMRLEDRNEDPAGAKRGETRSADEIRRPNGEDDHPSGNDPMAVGQQCTGYGDRLQGGLR